MPLNTPIDSWQNKRVWIVGASSGIGAALADALLARGARVVLSARNADALAAMAARFDGAATLVLPLDVTRQETLHSAMDEITRSWGGFDLVLFVAGDYKPARAWDFDLASVRQIVDTNLVGIFNVLSVVVNPLIGQGRGGIGLVSSVAGYRGLPQALVYGATKAAVINLAETLYLDLKPKGLDIYIINPGFVKTPMTAGNEFKMPALISPEEAAESTLRGFERGEFEIHYPKRFTRVLKLLRLLPYWLYFSLVRRGTGS
jgi:NAD(P)-dependent dehydrogenase (short-subunit alcohol dehydrogenase family)